MNFLINFLLLLIIISFIIIIIIIIIIMVIFIVIVISRYHCYYLFSYGGEWQNVFCVLLYRVDVIVSREWGNNFKNYFATSLYPFSSGFDLTLTIVYTALVAFTDLITFAFKFL